MVSAVTVPGVPVTWLPYSASARFSLVNPRWQVHGGRLLLDHPVIERALAGLALVVLQHVGLEESFSLGDVAGRAHFDGRPVGVALAEEDAA